MKRGFTRTSRATKERKHYTWNSFYNLYLCDGNEDDNFDVFDIIPPSNHRYMVKIDR